MAATTDGSLIGPAARAACLALLVAARAAGVRRLVYAASSSAYGDQPTLPKVEDMRPEPLSPYAAAKLVGEYYCQVWTRAYGFETVSLRYFNVFGPRQDPGSQYSGVISRFIDALMTGARPVIFGDGEQSRDFTYVANVVDANLRAAETTRGSRYSARTSVLPVIRFSVSSSSLSVTRSPLATLMTSPMPRVVSAARRFASTTFETYVKSRDCSPSP